MKICAAAVMPRLTVNKPSLRLSALHVMAASRAIGMVSRFD